MKDLIRSKTNNAEDFSEKYKKVKFISDDDLPLKKKLHLTQNFGILKMSIKFQCNYLFCFS